MLSMKEALCLSIEIKGNLRGHRSWVVLPPNSAEYSSNFGQWRTTCQRSCFSTSCEVKGTFCTFLALQIMS